MPVAYQRDGLFSPEVGPASPMDSLLGALNRHLAVLQPGALRTSHVPGLAPDVYFGCELDASGDCAEIEDLSDKHARRLRLAVAKPSREWIANMRTLLDSVGADRALLLNVELGQYWVHQRNILGAKEVRLGSDYIVRIPWLTSLESPVQVIQLTGALVDRDGRALRIGAEGMLVRRTDVVMSGLGFQSLVTDEDVLQLLRARREDLPGRPLVWESAMENLIRRLGITLRSR